ncbi:MULTISPECIES: nucleotide sugar dehydrogenase [Mycobacterium]|uniref:UDP-N-acetyl-D-glucosamine dehydrogenase n=1 Tax=Mycobacterium pseudoshottsii TaxID=265949 RepID=A0A9N7LT09_9MYCO|nr:MULTISPECIES: nucleotide sugar dehydrogenase [Mycobacterium]EPQ48107.1 UDP-glucose 6-dehydrogenase [Mycobacterium sp. 012931]MBC9862817.1 UDP-glucose/GDP-mannose dehydrogenase [Mycobacterium pseudoshottsii]RFZ63696.1 GDP-mannose 6-dehydrogenase [Mycobacterium marinum]BBA87891.1 UDP-N-acetyl-D-glucosamine dehydrogenase [Mycobacterium pseudoshottsii JCM 15466]BDN82093.1 UDP-N-acetyl-D-glucosamine dehydrogenase [Mycobacterium pseudoshottsii]
MTTQPSERICIVGGAGRVGLPLALVLADEGYNVDILDTNAEALETIMAGRMPFIETGAEDLLKRLLPTGRISGSTDSQVVRNSDIVICVVGTPVDEYLTPQAHTFFRVIDEISPYFHDGQTLILRSTVYPELSQRVHDMFSERGIGVHVTFCPERIAQGHSIRELRIIPQIISGFDAEGLRVVRELFSGIASEIIKVEPQEAELAKLFCNSYRYIQFAVANQFYLLSREAGLDFDRVHHAATYKNSRVDSLPRAGLAAGPCLLKDTMQLAAFSNNNFMLGHSAMLINEGQPQFIVNMLKRRVNLRDKTVGILGMTFKADCDDTRDSLSFKLRHLLMLEAKEVILHDPFLEGKDYHPLQTVVDRSDVIVVGVPHSAYRGLRVPRGKVVEDVWGCLDVTELDVDPCNGANLADLGTAAAR